MTNNPPHPAVTGKLAEDAEYLCEQSMPKRMLARIMGMTERQLHHAFDSKRFTPVATPMLLEALGVTTTDELSAKAEEIRKQPHYTPEEIGTAARKIRAHRGRTEGLQKEHMHVLLGCSESQYALIEKGEREVSAYLINRLPKIHSFASVKDMVEASKPLPDVSLRAHPAHEWAGRAKRASGGLSIER